MKKNVKGHNTKEKKSLLSNAGANGKISGRGNRKDTALAVFFRNNIHFAEVFNHTILQKDPIRPEELFPEDIRESAILQVTERGRITLTQYRDAVKCVKGAAFPVILGIENQSAVNYQMPFRVMARDFINYARQIRVISDQHTKEIKENKRESNAKNSNLKTAERIISVPATSKRDMESSQTGMPDEDISEGLVLEPDIDLGSEEVLRPEKDLEPEETDVKTAPEPDGAEYISQFYRTDCLFPCITLVIYWGDEPWEGPRGLADMFGESRWASYAQDYGMYVLEVQKMTEEEILSYNDDLKLAFGCVRYSHQKEELERFLTEQEKALVNASSLARDVVAEVTGLKKITKKFQVLSNDGGEGTMLRGFQEMFAKERAEGRVEGRTEGRVEGRAEERKNTERERLRAEKAEKELAEMKTRYELVLREAGMR
ncbi:MAG: Rpn family recombination-promoting nuclease/putative transposase [Clostridiales bacterium]|nr:Rpn family recombination-promoting nuclease/putative transposase [Clostridiales bacterium]